MDESDFMQDKKKYEMDTDSQLNAGFFKLAEE
jgi:hypothetical protein